MLHKDLLRDFFQKWFGAPRPVGKKHPSSARPYIESLEDRTVPVAGFKTVHAVAFADVIQAAELAAFKVDFDTGLPSGHAGKHGKVQSNHPLPEQEDKAGGGGSSNVAGQQLPHTNSSGGGGGGAASGSGQAGQSQAINERLVEALGKDRGANEASSVSSVTPVHPSKAPTSTQSVGIDNQPTFPSLTTTTQAVAVGGDVYNATLTADNHYILYTGAADGTGLTEIGRNEAGRAGNPGQFNWSEAESFTFGTAAGDFIYIVAWDGVNELLPDGGPQMLLGQFQRPDGSLLLTDSLSWEYAVGGPNPSQSGQIPDEQTLQSQISSASWSRDYVTAPHDGTTQPWQSISGISADADFLWSDTFDANAPSDAHYLIWRTIVPASPANHQPEAVDDFFTTNEDVPLVLDQGVVGQDLLANDSDADGDSLTLASVDAVSAQGGTVALQNGVVTYTPPADFFGTDIFQYELQDSFGWRDIGTVTVDVASNNDDIIGTLTADNHYGLYFGPSDGSALTLVGRNEFGRSGNPGAANWSLPEQWSFEPNPGDFIYVVAWDGINEGGGPQMWIGDFEAPDGTSLLSNTTDWQYIIGGQNPSTLQDPSLLGQLPADSELQSFIATADANNLWAAPDASAPNGTSPWGTIPNIDASADFLWNDTLAAASNSDAQYVVFRAEAPAVVPPTVKNADLLDIYFPQDGQVVPEKDQWTIGSFTVANINDTDGNGKIDKDEKQVLVAQANLAKDAIQGAKVVSVSPNQAKHLDLLLVDFVVNDPDKGGNFRESARNRIRIADNKGGEIVYVAGVDTTTNEITLTQPISRTYRIKDGGRVEIGEVDLMKLVIKPPTNADDGNATITIKGNVRLWETENKGKMVANVQKKTLSDKSVVQELTIPVKDLAKQQRTIWIEAIVNSDKLPELANELNSQGVRGIEIKMTYKDQVDTVRATAVWAIHDPKTQFFNSGPLKGDDVNPNGAMAKTFMDFFDGSLGMGVFHGAGPNKPLLYGGREEQEFTLLPFGVGKEKYVVPDMSRQVAGRVYFIQLGLMIRPFAPDEFPKIGWNRFEIATDDGNREPIDEDDKLPKSHDHIYQIDGPSISVLPTRSFVIDLKNFQEFVKFKFGPGASFDRPNLEVDGSTGSALYPWHLALYLKRGAGDPGDEMPGPLDKATAFVPDTDIVSASQPAFQGKGNGTITVPNLKDKTLSDKTGTLGWAAIYDKKADSWTLLKQEIKNGKQKIANLGQFARDPNKKETWKIVANKGNDQLSFVITEGKAKFEEGDLFQFGTFRSTSKKNEIAPGLIDITSEDKLFKSQQK